MTYRTPQALQHALNERARRHGVAGDQVLRRYLFARLLARIFYDDPNGWLLKGGQALLVRFEPRSRENRLDERGVARLSFDAYLGHRRKDSVSVDLVVDSRPIGRPECRQLAPPVPLDWPQVWPTVRLYPLVDHVADKIAAMYERHGDEGRLDALPRPGRLGAHRVARAAGRRSALRRASQRGSAAGPARGPY